MLNKIFTILMVFLFAGCSTNKFNINTPEKYCSTFYNNVVRTVVKAGWFNKRGDESLKNSITFIYNTEPKKDIQQEYNCLLKVAASYYPKNVDLYITFVNTPMKTVEHLLLVKKEDLLFSMVFTKSGIAQYLGMVNTVFPLFYIIENLNLGYEEHPTFSLGQSMVTLSEEEVNAILKNLTNGLIKFDS